MFQRSAAFTLPWSVRKFEPGELDALKADYPAIREAQRRHPVGAARLSAFSLLLDMLARPPVKSATADERRRAVDEGGVMGALNWGDVFFDIEANRMATELYGRGVARIVNDPETAASLVPTHPFACKRPIIDQGYYETFNRDNVTLVDLRKGGIRRVTPTGIDTEQGHYDLDVIIYATGFDAMTGALSRIDVRGRDGVAAPRRVGAARGRPSYLGLAVAGFPNLFTVQGPGSPSAATNYVAAHGAAHRMDRRLHRVSAARMATARSRHCPTRSTNGSNTPPRWWRRRCWLHPSCNSWYNGANVPGKKRHVHGLCGGHSRVPPALRRDRRRTATPASSSDEVV